MKKATVTTTIDDYELLKRIEQEYHRIVKIKLAITTNGELEERLKNAEELVRNMAKDILNHETTIVALQKNKHEYDNLLKEKNKEIERQFEVATHWIANYNELYNKPKRFIFFGYGRK